MEKYHSRNKPKFIQLDPYVIEFVMSENVSGFTSFGALSLDVMILAQIDLTHTISIRIKTGTNYNSSVIMLEHSFHLCYPNCMSSL